MTKSKAWRKVTGSLPPGGWLKVTCGLTAGTQGSAPGPTLGDEYGRNLWETLQNFIIYYTSICQ